MTNDLTQLKGVGPHIAERLHDAGFETTDEVLEADVDELTEVEGIANATGKAILEQSNRGYRGAPTKLDSVRDDILEAAKKPLNAKQIANRGGVARSTLFRWLDENEEFAFDYRTARSEAAEKLIEKGMDPSDEVDMRFVQFLLERSYEFYKTEKREIESENTHRMEGDGFVVEFGSGD